MFGYYEIFRDSSKAHLQLSNGENMTFIPHMHIQYELIYILEGSMLVTSNDEVKEIKKGELCFSLSNKVHSYVTKDYSKYFIAIFDPDIVSSFTALLRKKQFKSSFIDISSYITEFDAAIRVLSMESENQLLITGYLTVLLGYIYERAVIESSNTVSNSTLQLVLEYLCENYTSPLTLESVAIKIGISKYYLSRLCNNQLKISFTDYINNLRVSQARGMLRHTDSSVLTIAEECGFESLRTFNRVFKQLVGMTPITYRDKL